MKVMTWMRRGACAAFAACLVACGGGGDGSIAGTGTEPPAPVVNTAPTITTAPSAASVAPGQSVTFTVAASGSAPLAYQWLRNGTAIAGATTATYSLVPVLADNGAALAVRVSNAVASVTSTPVLLTVTAPPAVPVVTIVTQPQAAAAVVGASATFSVAAQASAAGTVLAYQWQRDGSAIAGATAASYTTPALTLADNGARYAVRVSGGGAAPVLSGEAVLTVTGVVAPPSAAGPAVSAGLGFGLALRRDGSVVLMGSNPLLDRIAGTPLAGTSARLVNGIAATQVAAGRVTALAVRADGLLFGWGQSFNGTLGGTEVNSNVDSPQRLNGVDGVVSAVPSSNYSLAVRNDGSVWHWPGVLTFSPQSVSPRQIAGLTGVSKVVAGMTGGVDGKTSPLAIKADGTVWSLSWTTVTAGTPPTQTHTGSATQVAGLANVVDISCTQHCLALLRDGTVVAWGRNAEGQIGNGSSGSLTPVPVAIAVPGLANVVAIGATVQASVAVTRDGRVWSWGGQFYNGQGATGTLTVPTVLSGISGAVGLAADDRLCLILLGDGTVRGFGSNGNGELEDGTVLERTTPVQATGLQLN